MKLVDLAKDLRLAAVDRIHPHRVVFHHVPKCGGTSVGRALRKRYLLSQSTINPEASFRAVAALQGRREPDELLPGVARLREEMLLYLLFQDVRCISAHVWFSEAAHERFKGAYKFITILREPISRFVSNHRWSFRKDGDHGRVDLPLDEFLGTEQARRFGSMYVQYFAGHEGRAGSRSPDAVRSAIRNVEKFDVVGQLQDLRRFEAEVQAKLGIRLRVGHENRSATASHGGGAGLDPSLRARIAEVCEPDLAVWEHFQGRSNAAAH